MANSLDSIFCSPSIVEILGLLDYRSYLKSKLINRRFYEVIKNNSRNRNLPRPRILLCAQSYIEKTTNSLYLVVQVVGSRISSYIVTDFCICFYSEFEKNLISRYYAENGIPYTTTPNSPDEYKLKAIGRWFKREPSLVYKTKNYNDGFREFFSVLLHQYHIEVFSVDSKLFNWPTFLEVLVASRHRWGCLELETAEPWPDFENVYTRLGCPDIEMDLYTPLEGFISNISHWSCRLQLRSFVENVEMIAPIVRLIKRWVAGVFGIKFLYVVTDCQDGQEWSFEMLHDVVRTNNIHPFHQKIIEDSRENDREEHIVMLFNRKHDESTLCFAYCPSRKRMIAYDCMYKGNPDEFQCNYDYAPHFGS